jgi:uncharacterized membrane protein HdeD (DUF308 family)
MIDLLKKHWWLLLVRGVLSIAFALAIFAVNPFFSVPFIREIQFALLTLLFGLFGLASGILTVLASLRSFAYMNLALLIDGLAISTASVMVLALPSLVLRQVIYMIACVAVFAGISEIVLAATLRREIEHEWLLMTAGVWSTLFGLYLGLMAEHDLVQALNATCVYALVSGSAMIGLAFRLRNFPLRRHAAAVR